MSERESMAAFARRRGVSKPCVSQWKTRGLLVLSDGLVDIAATEARLAARPAVYRGGRAGNRDRRKSASVSSVALVDDPSSWSTADAIRHKEIAQARLRQIEADTAAGLVVPIADVAKAVANEYAAVRAALLAMPSKLAHRLAAATTPDEAGALVDVEVRAALAALTQDGAL
jgi:predicted transcriptional regulator